MARESRSSPAPDVAVMTAGIEQALSAVFRGGVAVDGERKGYAVTSRAVMVYLKASGSSESVRPCLSAACGYIRKGSGGSPLPGSCTSCAVLKASQLPSQAPNNVLRAAI